MLAVHGEKVLEDTTWSDLAAHEGDLVLGGAFRIESSIGSRSARVLRLVDRAPGHILLVDTDEKLEAELTAPVEGPRHNGVIEVWAAGMLEPGLGCLITPDLPVPTLDDLLEEGPMSPARVIQILTGIVQPLIAVHDAGFTLFNLRPSVIRVIPGWGKEDVRIPAVPWGIGPAARQPLLGYCAPEYDYEPSPKCDQFSIGVIAFELLTGFTPHNPEGPPGERTAIPALPAPGVPDAMVPMLDKLLSHRLSDRYQDARGLAADLLELAEIFAPTDASVGHFTPVISSRMAVPPAPMTRYEPDTDELDVAPAADSILGYLLLLAAVGLGALALSYVILQLW